MLNKLFLLLILVSSSYVYSNEYVGSSECVDCHKEEVDAWKGSGHDLSMQHADIESVLGDFNNKEISFKNRKALFFKKDDSFYVRITENKIIEEFKISYTFGYNPLQQYMVKFDDGRIQLIPFSWDSRSKELGGQRWFDLYPDTSKTETFYWKNTGQNWNFMCADCHSTNVEKGYNKEENTYKTTWSEINVSCESCHGAAKDHLKIVKGKGKTTKGTHYGFNRDLSKSVEKWMFEEGKTTLKPESIKETDQITVCAQCHSRRLQINETEDTIKGDLLDKYIVSNITPELYHSDGQIYDEDYVLGSFEQSKMAENGVTCSNCHEPHKAKLKIKKEAVCLQCHIASEYTEEKHTFHSPDKAGGQCVDCHMPETTYMQVDKRRDHSWHVPSAKKSALSNSPNVCVDCHKTKDLKWADSKVKGWFPDSTEEIDKNTPAVAFQDQRMNKPNVDAQLSHVAQNKNNSDIIRASALERLRNYPTKNAYITILRSVKNENSKIRLSAAQGSSNMPFTAKLKILFPLLEDKVYAVRAEAAAQLLMNWGELNDQQKEKMKIPLSEYIMIQEFNSDRGFGRTNLGNVYIAKGNTEKAIVEYKGAIEIEPYYEPSYVSLSAAYEQTGRSKEAREILELGVVNNPNSETINYSMAMNLLRGQDKKGAITYIEKSLSINPNNAQNWYTLGLVYESIDLNRSISSLENAFKIGKNPQHLYSKCEIELRNGMGVECLKELKSIVPDDVITGLKNKYK